MTAAAATMLRDSRPPRDDGEDAAMRALLADGDVTAVTESAIRRYGGELLSWLHDTLPDDDAEEAFAVFALELWKSLSRFDGRCAVRTWCYMLVRQAAWRVRTRPERRREVLVTHIPSVAHAVTQIVSTSRARAAAERDLYAELRRGLDEDDQLLLVLRVDRDLAWRDIAQVLLGEDAAYEDLARHAAQLRKRFERIKTRLRAAAAAAARRVT